MTKTPASLLERLRRPGDQEAWERFVKLYAPMILQWARQAGLEENAAADLVQDVFVILVREMPGFRYDARKSFRAWLKAVTLNRWREQARRRVKVAPVDHLPEPACPADTLFEEAEYRRYVVGRAMRLLQADCEPVTWKAWWEYVVVGRPAGEVAGELGLTANAVYLIKARLLTRLREELEGLLD